MTALTIGMATYNDFEGVYFTLQSLRLYHDLTDTELVVIDNYGCEHTRRFVEGISARYILAPDLVGTAPPRNRLFQEAIGNAVLCCDSHVQFWPGAVARLRAFYREHPRCPDLLQGPLIMDDLVTLWTHLELDWRADNWETRHFDPRGYDVDGEPFEIPAQGLGMFSCHRGVWLGFNGRFRGFGGEEGYIHEKFRQRGARTLCLPWFRWLHRFPRPAGIPYSRIARDYLRNSIIGHLELGLDLMPMLDSFVNRVGVDWVISVVRETQEELGITLPIDPAHILPHRATNLR